MVPLTIIKEQYQRMSDEALQAFAVNEAGKLTIESFHLLKEEFERRNLDLGILEAAEVDKSLSELGKQDAFEKAATDDYVAGIWQYAMDEKAAGKTNAEIYNGLLQKGVDQTYAGLLIQSLGTKSRELKEAFNNEILFGWLAAVAGFVLICLGITGTLSGLSMMYGVVILGGGAIRLYKSYSQKDKFEKIEQNVQQESEAAARIPRDELTGRWENVAGDRGTPGMLWGWSFLFNENGTGVYHSWNDSRLSNEAWFVWERLGVNVVKAKYVNEDNWYVITYTLSETDAAGGEKVHILRNDSYSSDKAGEEGFWSDIEVLYRKRS